ncbi:MAG: hypothetical protein DRO23_02390 [Thermoprotei archaeon]|nr:MAG: hypothetical protein DRO23_02390 [Thermoprotei archaeon]
MRINLKILMGNYKYIELSITKMLDFLEILSRKFPDKFKDVSEVKRIVKNYDVFYDIAKRKFKDYILIPHEPSDMLRGRILFDKVKLIKDNHDRKIGLIFDKSVKLKDIVEALNSLGLEVNIVETNI